MPKPRRLSRTRRLMTGIDFCATLCRFVPAVARRALWAKFFLGGKDGSGYGIPAGLPLISRFSLSAGWMAAKQLITRTGTLHFAMENPGPRQLRPVFQVKVHALSFPFCFFGAPPFVNWRDYTVKVPPAVDGWRYFFFAQKFVSSPYRTACSSACGLAYGSACGSAMAG